ncbi:zinc finger protein ZFPM1 isoform X2 [Anguilla anguilla]|uniref:zinc finger protein ZFPM1 isoform X2 n=1 Tax=Anguilla anguilla TaxID=7936 RepID=UPI0015B1E900|nr:zinc finger protein ZFPM1 isoform X2 [Anguilla anguilla]
MGTIQWSRPQQGEGQGAGGRGQELYCKVTQELHAGDRLLATLFGPTMEERSTATETHNAPVKEEEPAYPAALHSEIQLLPQQAGMAAILATAVINKDIFPCKDCGIWYRSERNLQAHLMYYCASRQKQDPASPPPEKPRDSYPNERVCPFPHCNKSCPSASSLEIHMRTHSGERPFVCLICLSAFTTKANCERHLKVHTDTLNGVCHGCGFVSTTRDILYSHLVTCHMVCQPGSRSEVYSPGPGLPPLPLATGLGPPDCGVVLKCQVCGFGADSPALLQQHVRTHLEVRGVAERSPAPRRTPPSSSESPEPACAPLPDSDTPGANGGSATPREGGRSPLDSGVRVKEEPPSDSENEGDEGPGLNGKEGAGPDGRPGTASVTQTPPTAKTPPSVAVKAEPPSPTPGSSPAHQGGVGAGLPGGAVFLPQYMFGPEAILPQASEILAKMSEMVHSRLKQGHAPGVGAATAAFYTAAGSPIQKGATCFECDITFNNVNNFYVHKRLYCSSRHQQQGDTPAAAPIAAPQAKDGAEPPAGISSSSPVSEATRAPSASRSDAEPPQGGAADGKRAEVKSEDAGPREPSGSEGESGSGGRASESSPSPGGASGEGEDPDEDPAATFCQACNIRFSRHENYMVHKRFYCASRHDPSNQRPHHSHGKAAAFLPQPVRTRKRKKMYEIHMARAQALARSASTPNPAPTPTTGVKQEGVSAPSPGTCPEGEGPIDLSKRPRLREPQRALPPAPPLPLTDYHKCTACCISFNSIENYLAHKAYYCPATPLQQQQRPLEQLHKLRRPASTSPAPRPGLPELHAERLGVVKGAKIEPAPALHSPLGPEGAPLHFVPGMKALGSPQPPMVCPYCPQSGGVVGDLMEHFRTTHGLVLALQPGGVASPEAPPPNTTRVSPSMSPRSSKPATPPKQPGRDNVNGQVKRESISPTSSSPLLNGSPMHRGAPSTSPPSSSPGTTPLPVLHQPETLKEAGLHSQSADKPNPHGPAHLAPKAALVSPLQNGNSRYCRLCNIRFSSLSTFIAHKKYYCSSHSAEHVK